MADLGALARFYDDKMRLHAKTAAGNTGFGDVFGDAWGGGNDSQVIVIAMIAKFNGRLTNA
jgi:hypothetical protein